MTDQPLPPPDPATRVPGPAAGRAARRHDGEPELPAIAYTVMLVLSAISVLPLLVTVAFGALAALGGFDAGNDDLTRALTAAGITIGVWLLAAAIAGLWHRIIGATWPQAGGTAAATLVAVPFMAIVGIIDLFW